MQIITRAIAALVIEGAGLMLAVAPAHATVYRSFTTFSWSGGPCIKALSPDIGNHTALTWDTVCPGGGFYQINETLVQSGQWIGVRIPLTDESQVNCTTWLGPQGGLMSVYANDSADSNLGSGEADCLRQVP
ncbi:hypothetical protein H7K24_14170 [Mycobacterium fragae]|uniref:Uncharacterized protein n=1 Tax=Mycobacterium fragae TaxID=1260918 RepID=A0A1X1UJ23_9MYCO|nr:hypothetical protein [Mycobacterium fragae]MCV7401299.1 hypothetical protein [Mycobacterium fragae]ORV56781.1 hypothetical protein AWC06_00770 [Mycobacterium fragae]